MPYTKHEPCGCSVTTDDGIIIGQSKCIKHTTDRFFARVHAADLSCPKCGKVLMFGQGRPGKLYNPRTARLRCPHCARIWVVGLVLYSVKSGPRERGGVGVPRDQVPTDREALDMRAQLGLWASEEEAQGTQPERTNKWDDSEGGA